MNQRDRLLDYLKAHGRIDPLSAWQEIGIYRLAPRVLELRQAGHSIAKETVEVRNRYGESCRVACYRLVEA